LACFRSFRRKLGSELTIELIPKMSIALSYKIKKPPQVLEIIRGFKLATSG
jgi:hypothetical protein